MKKTLAALCLAIISGICGWLLNDAISDAFSNARGSAFMQLFKDIRIASEKKFSTTGTFFRSLSDIPKDEISFADGGSPELLRSIVYVADADLKSAFMCSFFLEEIQLIRFDGGETFQISPPCPKKAEQGAAANP